MYTGCTKSFAMVKKFLPPERKIYHAFKSLPRQRKFCLGEKVLSPGRKFCCDQKVLLKEFKILLRTIKYCGKNFKVLREQESFVQRIKNFAVNKKVLSKEFKILW